jgi:antirestriction protein ArdC
MATKSTEKFDIYQTVTDRIVTLLEAGTAPWRKPWTAANAPRNIEGYAYKGINVFILGAAGYESPFWMTYKQAQKRGGNVRKGEKSTMIVFWKISRFTDKDAKTGEKTTKTVPMLRYFRVFNVEQTEGVKLPRKVAEWKPTPVSEFEGFEAAEKIMADYPDGPSINETGDAAFYVPALDAITLPPRSAFENPAEFYSTAFHEMGHSTGHAKRLNREGITGSDGFGGHVYGREELVAEMTSAFLCAEAGIEVTHDNSAAYLASWIRTIKADPRAVVVAAGKAQKAAEHVLGREQLTEEIVTEDEASEVGEEVSQAA